MAPIATALPGGHGGHDDHGHGGHGDGYGHGGHGDGHGHGGHGKASSSGSFSSGKKILISVNFYFIIILNLYVFGNGFIYKTRSQELFPQWFFRADE